MERQKKKDIKKKPKNKAATQENNGPDHGATIAVNASFEELIKELVTPLPAKAPSKKA